MKQYIKPDAEAAEYSPVLIVCGSLTGGSSEDFTESEDIDWNW